jgi:large subunit ribosomal protein L3
MPLASFFWLFLEKTVENMDTILGSKVRMGQTFVKDTRVPVTYVKAGPCIVTQVKSADKDGYWAVQLGFGEKRIRNVTKPLVGHLKGATKNKKAPRFLREVRFDKAPDFKVGDEINFGDVFKKGDVLAVTGISKGKGFQGVMKRWGFGGGPRTHGQSDRPRSPGSIGQGTTPGRVHKGKKMAGRMGIDTVTVKNLKVVDFDEENGLMLVSGSVPGNKGSLLIIKKIASGRLDELVQEVPEAQIQEGEQKENDDKAEVGQTKQESESSN